MISEISFAKNYSSFWTEYTPWTKDYVHSLNSGLAEHYYSPISEKDDPKYRSINNIVSFTLFKNNILSKNNNIEDAYNESITILKNYPRTNLETYILSKQENVNVINSISDRLTRHYKNKTLTFYPQFNGCGILNNCQGDLYYPETLIEIKAGDRNISAQDLRQLLIYAALNWLSETYPIKHIELFNPRTGILWNSSVSEFVSSISDLSLEDLFGQIGKQLSDLSEDVLF